MSVRLSLAAALVSATLAPAGELTPKVTFKGHTNTVVAVAFSPDGKLLATAGKDKTIRVWEIATGERKERIPHKAEVYSLAWSPNGKLLVSGDSDCNVTLWDGRSFEKVRTIEGVSSQPIGFLTFAPDGRALAAIGLGKYAVDVWDAATGKQKFVLEGHAADCNAVAFSPDGAKIATVGDDATVRIWDAQKGGEIDNFKAHDGYVLGLDFSPDGKRLATGGADKTVVQWDLKSGNVIKPVFEGDGWPVRWVKYLPDGRLLTRNKGSGLRLREANGKATVLSKDFEGNIFGGIGAYYGRDIAFSSDGRLLAEEGKDHGVDVFDLSEAIGGR